MATEACVTKQPKGLGFFEKYLTVWVSFRQSTRCLFHSGIAAMGRKRLAVTWGFPFL